MHELEHFYRTHTERREVRALARAHPLTTPLEQRTQKPRVLSFERKLDAPTEEEHDALCLLRFPFEALERWREWPELERDAPLVSMSNLERVYDPSGALERVARTLGRLTRETLREHAQKQLEGARLQLEDYHKRLARPDHRSSEQILALVRARALLRSHLYPALLSARGQWFESRLGYPELLRQLALLEAPRAVYLLNDLYGFPGEAEVRRMIPATRGLGMPHAEREVRAALEAGYQDGAALYLRDETARRRLEDLAGWTHLAPARRERLSLLLGLERAPLGGAALERAGEVLRAVAAAVSGIRD